MTDRDQIYEALEATTQGKRQGSLSHSYANASDRDILNHRDSLLRFLHEIEDGDISVSELIDILEEYGT